MAKTSRINARELAEEAGEDLRFQIASWRVQRIGWGLALVVLGAALLGAFGHGPLSQATAATPDGRTSIAFERFARHGDPTTIDLTVHGLASDASSAVVWLSDGYVDGIEILGIVPEPARVIDGQGRKGFEFELAGGHAGELDVTFEVEFQEVLLRSGSVQVDGGESVALTQFVYP